jgi:hypothetical protein
MNHAHAFPGFLFFFLMLKVFICICICIFSHQFDVVQVFFLRGQQL